MMIALLVGCKRMQGSLTAASLHLDIFPLLALLLWPSLTVGLGTNAMVMALATAQCHAVLVHSKKTILAYHAHVDGQALQE